MQLLLFGGRAAILAQAPAPREAGGCVWRYEGRHTNIQSAVYVNVICAWDSPYGICIMYVPCELVRIHVKRFSRLFVDMRVHG